MGTLSKLGSTMTALALVLVAYKLDSKDLRLLIETIAGGVTWFAIVAGLLVGLFGGMAFYARMRDNAERRAASTRQTRAEPRGEYGPAPYALPHSYYYNQQMPPPPTIQGQVLPPRGSMLVDRREDWT